MKLLKTDEIKSATVAQNFKDVIRTQQVKETLKEANTQLDDVEMKFETTLAKQRVLWAKLEEEALKKLKELEEEWTIKKSSYETMLVPIEELDRKSHNLFQEAERILESARAKSREAEQAKADAEELKELLTEKIDGLTECEDLVKEREVKMELERLTLDHEREDIRKLSSELTQKLNSLYGSNRLGISA